MMPFAEANGQRLYWEMTRGEHTPIVFSHGIFMDRGMFAPQVERFGKDHRCIVWDERGHGLTGEALEPFSYWDSAEDLVAVLSAAGVERAALAGMSQGGYLTLRAALAHPEVVQGLILIDTQSRSEDPENVPRYEQLIDHWTTDGMDDELAGVLEGIILGSGFAHAEQWRAKWREFAPENVRQLFATLMNRDDVTERLGELTMPTLVVHGGQDAAVPVERAEELAARIPDAELVVIPDAGHAANLTHPDEVNPHIERFLGRLR